MIWSICLACSSRNSAWSRTVTLGKSAITRSIAARESAGAIPGAALTKIWLSAWAAGPGAHGAGGEAGHPPADRGRRVGRGDPGGRLDQDLAVGLVGVAALVVRQAEQQVAVEGVVLVDGLDRDLLDAVAGELHGDPLARGPAVGLGHRVLHGQAAGGQVVERAGGDLGLDDLLVGGRVDGREGLADPVELPGADAHPGHPRQLWL